MDQAKATKPSIRIMRPGTFRSVEGRDVAFGEAELASIAAAYDPATDPAPLVIGHPKIEDQAYGWVDRITVENGQLVAHPSRIDETFADRVRKGDYAKVSASFYEPTNPHNPKPGTYYLKHIGFLGAHAPGVKGLGSVQFAQSDTGDTLTIETEKDDTMTGKTGGNDTNENTNVNDAKKGDTASFAERQAELDAREKRIADRERAAEDSARAARHDGNVSFAEGLLKEAKLAPAGKDLLVGILDQAGEASAEATVSFGEGQSIKLDAAIKKLLSDASPLVSFAEVAGADKKITGSTASFAAPAGYTVSADKDAIYAEAKSIQAGAPTRPWMDCVRDAEAALAS